MIEYHVYRVLRGEYGVPDRRDRLDPSLYEPVKNEVNRILGQGKRYYW